MVRGNGNETQAVGGEGVPEGLLSSPELRRMAGARGRELIDRAQQLPATINRANDSFVGFVKEQPLIAIGAACALGYVLGRALRRVV